MLKAIETYLALRRTTGFAMLNAEYLLRSFAAFHQLTAALAERGLTIHPASVGRFLHREAKALKKPFCRRSSSSQS
ncbi:hypothetical protein NKH23_32830 [Mesorhizobium sp. M1328]|uniref:hypothetical protein n=1 Tax=Mesorhizobium sp. M1328 TaxID=2957082 RepID=UPI003336287F